MGFFGWLLVLVFSTTSICCFDEGDLHRIKGGNAAETELFDLKERNDLKQKPFNSEETQFNSEAKPFNSKTQQFNLEEDLVNAESRKTDDDKLHEKLIEDSFDFNYEETSTKTKHRKYEKINKRNELDKTGKVDVAEKFQTGAEEVFQKVHLDDVKKDDFNDFEKVILDRKNNPKDTKVIHPSKTRLKIGLNPSKHISLEYISQHSKQEGPSYLKLKMYNPSQSNRSDNKYEMDVSQNKRDRNGINNKGNKIIKYINDGEPKAMELANDNRPEVLYEEMNDMQHDKVDKHKIYEGKVVKEHDAKLHTYGHGNKSNKKCNSNGKDGTIWGQNNENNMKESGNPDHFHKHDSTNTDSKGNDDKETISKNIDHKRTNCKNVDHKESEFKKIDKAKKNGNIEPTDSEVVNSLSPFKHDIKASNQNNLKNNDEESSIESLYSTNINYDDKAMKTKSNQLNNRYQYLNPLGAEYSRIPTLIDESGRTEIDKTVDGIKNSKKRHDCIDKVNDIFKNQQSYNGNSEYDIEKKEDLKDQISPRYDQIYTKKNHNCKKDKIPTKKDRSFTKNHQSSTKTDQSSTKTDQSSTKTDQSSTKNNQSCTKKNKSSGKKNQSLTQINTNFITERYVNMEQDQLQHSSSIHGNRIPEHHTVFHTKSSLISPPAFKELNVNNPFYLVNPQEAQNHILNHQLNYKVNHLFNKPESNFLYNLHQMRKPRIVYLNSDPRKFNHIPPFSNSDKERRMKDLEFKIVDEKLLNARRKDPNCCEINEALKRVNY